MFPTSRIALLVDPLTAVVGGGRHARELAQALAERQHEVRVFGLAPSSLAGDGAERREKNAPAPRVRVGASVLSFRPDAILAYDARSPAAWLGARIARRLRIPLVLVEPGAWGEGLRLQNALWRVGERLWGSYVRRTAGALIALEPATRDHALDRGFAAARVSLVPHGVDVEHFRPGLSSDELLRHRVRGRILAYCGALDGRVDLELLIDAFARTVGRRDDWSLVIAGESHAPARLRACAERLGVGARTHLLSIGEAALPALLSSSTLFAQPNSLGSESTLQLSRALACGVPVLASDCYSGRAVLRPGEHGLLAESGNLAEWTEVLRKAAGSPEARKRWSSAARKFAQEHLSWRAVALEFEAAIASAARRSVEPRVVRRPPPASTVSRGGCA
jgi:glycosyltransferase involved in cell wall biosynthesis